MTLKLKLYSSTVVAAIFAAATTAAEPASGAMAQLVQVLVAQKSITPEQGELLVRASKEEKAEVERRVTQAVLQAMQTAQASAPVPAPAAPGAIRVQHVPEVVKQQLREDIKQEVMKQAREENWAAPRSYPEWIERFKFSGDLRFRYEGISYPDGNDLTGAFSNFHAINTGSPYDVSSVSNPNFEPLYNADQDRTRTRVRARLGTEIDLAEGFTGGLRLATGESSSPVTANQTFGANGGFGKYAAWIDRAFLRYDFSLDYDKEASLTVGRFDNPFFATNLLWADDLGFDGVLGRVRLGIGERFSPFFTAGLFPVYNTDLNFSSNQPEKFKSEDKWLYGAQLGFDWRVRKDLNVRFGAAYYAYDNIEGRLSTPYIQANPTDAGDTDSLRPAFAQKGNTYMALRNIIPTAENNFGTEDQYQYFGLATPFREVALTTRVDYSGFAPFFIWFEAEAVKNLAYDENKIDSRAVNNRDASGAFVGGDFGWLARLNFGDIALDRRWQWNVSLGYKYVESDAVVDGFTDSDFGLGGTNLKGYTLAAHLALAKRVWLRARWMSADSIDGPRFQVDTLQFDINAKF